jgi:hypothetical protein
MQLSIKLGDTDVIFYFNGVNTTNPKMTFLIFKTDKIAIEAFGVPENYDATNALAVKQLQAQFCLYVAEQVELSLRKLKLAEPILSLPWKENIRPFAEDPTTKIPTQFVIYFPQTMEQELRRVLTAPHSEELVEPVEDSGLLAAARQQQPADFNDADEPPSLHMQPPPPPSQYQPRAASPSGSKVLPVQPVKSPLPLQSQELHECITKFEDVFTRCLVIDIDDKGERKYGRDADNRILVRGTTIISNFAYQYLVANVKSLIPKSETFTTPGKRTDKISDFPKYTADLDMAVNEVWNSIRDKLLVVEELRLELVDKEKELQGARARLNAPDQNPEIERLTNKFNALENQMREKENEIIFIMQAYSAMFRALRNADGLLQEYVYEAKFKAIETCQETLVKLGWKGRLFIGFCTLLGVIIGGIGGFFLGANGGIIAGAAAGTVLFPVPIVGTVKGAIVGGTATGIWAAIKAGGIGGGIGAGVGAFLLGFGSFALSRSAANHTYSMDSANLHFFKACNKVVKHAQYLEEPTPNVDPRARALAKMAGANSP